MLAIPLGAMGPAPVAHAHGRFPATGEVAFHPTDPDVILLRTTFGLLATDDGGGVFRWVCPAAFGARMTEDPHVTIAADGSFVVGLFDGLSRGTGGGCDWDFPSAELTDRVVIDVTRASDGTLYALTSDGGAPNGVHRSLDEGLTWTATDAAIDSILFETIRVAPSDPSQVYLTGAYPPTADTPRRPFVYHSADGGVTWDSVAFSDFRADDRNVYLLGVDPTDSGRLMVRVRGDFGDRVYVSEDSAQTFTEGISVGEVDAFAWSTDGTTVWLGGRTATGLHRSDDGGQTFSVIDADLRVGCLGLRGSELFVCADNYEDGYAFGRSTDGGATITPMLLFADVPGTVMCPAGAATPAACEGDLADLLLDLGLDDDAGLSDGGGSGSDGGPEDAAADGGDGGVTEPASGGCACGTAAGSHRGPTPGPALALGLLIVFAFFGRRRRP
ncbi:MAG: exo-alpha-sialidase [Deltaproteobacteria bacterium]|nr:exo-alpha-sialidase [Deltaproteobacteria bacterium]